MSKDGRTSRHAIACSDDGPVSGFPLDGASVVYGMIVPHSGHLSALPRRSYLQVTQTRRLCRSAAAFCRRRLRITPMPGGAASRSMTNQKGTAKWRSDCQAMALYIGRVYGL